MVTNRKIINGQYGDEEKKIGSLSTSMNITENRVKMINLKKLEKKALKQHCLMN